MIYIDMENLKRRRFKSKELEQLVLVPKKSAGNRMAYIGTLVGWSGYMRDDGSDEVCLCKIKHKGFCEFIKKLSIKENFNQILVDIGENKNLFSHVVMVRSRVGQFIVNIEEGCPDAHREEKELEQSDFNKKGLWNLFLATNMNKMNANKALELVNGLKGIEKKVIGDSYGFNNGSSYGLQLIEERTGVPADKILQMRFDFIDKVKTIAI